MKFFKYLVVLLLGFCLILTSVLAVDFPSPTGYVNDFAGMLSPSFRQELESDLGEFEKETTVEITVATIESLQDNSLEDYAVRLFEGWQIGKKEKDNGLLILIAKEERKMRIEVGYGLEPIITDGRAGRIIRDKMRPAFKAGDYDLGVKEGVEQIEDYIRSGEPPVGEEAVKEKAAGIFPLLVFGFVFLMYFSSFWGRSKRWWPGGIIGGLEGTMLGWIMGTTLALALGVIGFGLLGLFLDYFLSKNYKKLKRAGKSTGFWRSFGGFSSGGRSSSGSFGGFGGGSSGGGGASGGW